MSEFFKDQIDILDEEEINEDHNKKLKHIAQSLRRIELFQNQTENNLLLLAKQVKEVQLKAGE